MFFEEQWSDSSEGGCCLFFIRSIHRYCIHLFSSLSFFTFFDCVNDLIVVHPFFFCLCPLVRAIFCSYIHSWFFEIGEIQADGFLARGKIPKRILMNWIYASRECFNFLIFKIRLLKNKSKTEPNTG